MMAYNQKVAAQHSVQLTVGTRRVFWHFSGFGLVSVSRASLPSHPPQLTPAVGCFAKVSNDFGASA